MTAVNALPQKIAHEITAMILTGDLAPDAKLNTQRLADRFAVSRTPIREALALLEQQGVVQQQVNRGFYVKPVSARLKRQAMASASVALDGPPAYYKLAEDWLRDAVPEELTEVALIDRYQLSRAELTAILTRAVSEGWIERKAGYGWRLLPVAKTPVAQEQLYRMRLLLEPVALLEPSFSLNRQAALALQNDLKRVRDHAYLEWPADRLHALGVRFHEDLLQMSGNPFLVQAVQRVNRMRRLLEYRSMIDRHRVLDETTEHLEILGPLLAGDVVQTSFLMRQHIAKALLRKSKTQLVK